MKRILTALVLLTGLFGAGGAVWAGDFDKGMKAMKRADYDIALKEFRPLAEQGHAEAQFQLGLILDKNHYGYGPPRIKLKR
jgi:TPR repeat protein